jgi:hypothetical protein
LIKPLFDKYFELIFWVCGLTWLAFISPSAASHFSLCPLKALGFTWCPGCGLGHSISFLFHGNIKASFHAHWFGIPALLIILYRIFTLWKLRFSHKKAGELVSNTEY